MMNLFERISEEEQAMLVHQIENYAVAPNRHEEMKASLHHVLRAWEGAKSKYLARMFGDELILTRDIEFHKDIDELETDIGEIMEHNYPKFFQWLDAAFFYNPWHRNWDNPNFEVPQYIMDCSEEVRNDMYAAIREMTSYHGLAENVYHGKTIEFPTPNGKPLKINQGCRITKALGKMVTTYGLDKEEFEQFRIKHSQVLNQKALKGRLCLSIHPLDYVTMSDNASGWSSCMSWEEEGCYRQGTVEMLNSPCVVVAYLRSEDDMRISYGHYWANKKWRELYVVTPDLISNVKGYPYCNSDLTSVVLKWLRELAIEAGVGAAYTEEVHQHCPNDEWLDNRGLTLEFGTNHMYNDFGHDHQYCVINPNLHDREIYTDYSGYSECMICGELDPEFVDQDEARSLVCIHCDNVRICDCCGNAIYDEDFYMPSDGSTVCCNCHDEYYVTNAFDGLDYHRDEMERICICDDAGEKVLDNYQFCLWVELGDDRVNELSIDGTFVNRRHRWNDVRCVPYSKVSDKFIALLDEWNCVDREELEAEAAKEYRWTPFRTY